MPVPSIAVFGSGTIRRQEAQVSGISRARKLFDELIQGGEATIDRLIAEEISEELFIDYKRSANDGDDSKLHYADRENFARAVGGFGNSEGGVVVWGVDCRNDPQRGDVPSDKHPIKQVERFLSFLEGVTSGCTLPPHDGVRHHLIEQSGTPDGFVASYVPKSMFAPHQCIVGRYKSRYYIRVGSNFEIASHGLLAGMFGRQPTPSIFVMWGCGGKMAPASYDAVVTPLPTSTPYVWNEVVIRNDGVTVVRDLYVNIDLQVPGPNCLGNLPRRANGWSLHESIGGWHLISDESYRLAPASMIAPIVFSIYLKPPFDSPLHYEISYGCSGSPVHRILTTVPPEDIGAAYTAFVESDRGKKAGFDLARNVFRLQQDQEISSEPDESGP